MSLYGRLLGHPFVYEHIRPRLVGGVDFSPMYRMLEVQVDDVVLDVGCGTGDALRHLTRFGRYVGVDVDPTAIAFARKTWAGRADATFEHKLVGAADVAALRPTRVVLGGVLHHMSDDDISGLLAALRASDTVARVASLDIVYLPGHLVSNALAFLDRGRHCRTPEGYQRLIRRAGYVVHETAVVRSHPTNGRVKYFVMTFSAAPS
jgi:SAM-dependent methyltransferase